MSWLLLIFRLVNAPLATISLATSNAHPAVKPFLLRSSSVSLPLKPQSVLRVDLPSMILMSAFAWSVPIWLLRIFTDANALMAGMDGAVWTVQVL